MSHGSFVCDMSHMNKPWLICVTILWLSSNESWFIRRVSNLILRWVVAHSYVTCHIWMHQYSFVYQYSDWILMSRGSFVCGMSHRNEPWLICASGSILWLDSKWAMAHSYVTCHIWINHDSFVYQYSDWIPMSRGSFVRGMSHTNEPWLICVSSSILWLNCKWVMVHSYVTWLIHMSHVTFM